MQDRTTGRIAEGDVIELEGRRLAGEDLALGEAALKAGRILSPADLGLLASLGQAEVPVLTIALDAGFQSLAPFNRAFKATTGVTPTEYRRRRGAAA